MPELIRSIATRFREYLGNRRRAQRYRVRLSVSVMPAPDVKTARAPSAVRDALYGYTRDVSSTGLALVLPTIRINNTYLTGEERTLEILVEDECEPIVIYAAPVRYEKLDDEGKDKGYLIGVRIIEMSDDDRARFIELLSKSQV